MMDVTLRLRELRRASGLTQKEIAKRSGLGIKSISSFESGHRVESLKLSQLRRILSAYGVTEAEFFSDDFEQCAINNCLVIPSPVGPPSNARSRMSVRLFAALATLDDLCLSRAVKAIEKFAAEHAAKRDAREDFSRKAGAA